MNSREIRLFSLLAACADCVVRAGEPGGKAGAGALIARRQTELHQALLSMFITPMERGDLYLPACLCAREIRCFAALPENGILLSGFRACAKAQHALLSALPGFRTPERILPKCRALRREVLDARRSGAGGADGQRLFDSFLDMADLTEYLLLKNN